MSSNRFNTHIYSYNVQLQWGMSWAIGNGMIVDQPNASQMTIGKIQSLLVRHEDLFLHVSICVCFLVHTMELYAGFKPGKSSVSAH